MLLIADYHSYWVTGRPILEILILAILIYQALYYLRGTRGSNILAGLIIFLLMLTVVCDLIKLEVLNWIIGGIWTLLAMAVIVIFQPELRRAFAHLGNTGFRHSNRKKEVITEVVTAVLNMSKRRIGAIIVVERGIGLRAIVEDAVKLDIKLNSLILESIFFPNSPLHDGAVIINDDKIIAAHAILPLSRDEALARSMGTRHRAAIGITEDTDSVVVVVSEETGKISVACRGDMRRDIKGEQLLPCLTSLLIANNRISNIFGKMEDNDILTGFSRDQG
jgi:diadenylate cyclase